MLDIVALGASCDLLKRTGLDTIHREINRLAERLRSGLSHQGFDVLPRPADSGGIVSISVEDALLTRMTHQLTQRYISFAKRGPGLRLSPHAFNSDSDIDETLQALQKL